MAAPVWVLSVDLQAKTATFATGMADAARAARGSFQDIKSSASDMGEGVSRGTTNVRAALGLLDNSIRGNHAAAMADLVREFSQTSFVMAALPFAAVAGGFLFLGSLIVGAAEKIKEFREEQEKVGQDQTKMGTAINNVFNGLDIKLLEAGKQADELTNNHLGALQKELAIIDKQSMNELISSFAEVAKASDALFGDLKNSWYQFGSDSTGAAHALAQFKAQYESLLSQGKDKEAHDLLAGTRDSAEKTLNAQRTVMNGSKGGREYDPSDLEFLRAKDTLQRAGIGYDEKALQASVTLVNTLNAQLGVETRIAAIKAATSGNAGRSAAMAISRESSEAARQSIEIQMQMAQQAVEADKAKAEALLTISNASAGRRMQVELDFAKRSYDVQVAGNAQQIAALDKLGKDYPSQLKALHEKALEVEQQYQTQVAEIIAKGQVGANQKAVQDLQESERAKIDATRQGSAERLAAIDQAIKEEEAKNRQDTDNYRSLLTQRVEVVRQMAQEEVKARLDALSGGQKNQHTDADADAKNTQGHLGAINAGIDQREAAELAAANRSIEIDRQGFAQRLAELQKFGTEYQTDILKLQQEQTEAEAKYQATVKTIQGTADNERTAEYTKTMAKMAQGSATAFMSMVTGQRSASAEMTSLARQVATNLLSSEMQQIAGHQSTELANAKLAASNVYATVSGWPVVGPFLAPELAAGAFAGAMAFADGGIVPGVTKGDTVPAMLTPGEGVVPGGVMDGLSKLARSGNMGSGGDTHVHINYRPHLHALDTAGMDKLLKKHADTIHKHVQAATRKSNR